MNLYPAKLKLLDEQDAYEAPAVEAVGLAPQLSVVIPTYNERENIEVLLDRLREALAGIHWEVIFVDDDSPDGTASLITELAATDARIRQVLRVGRRGLSGACIEGMLTSSAPLIAVMDADLQHDQSLLPKMAAVLLADEADLVVGSRYVADGAADSFSSRRLAASRFSTRLAQFLLRVELTDPMSGFFMIRRDSLREIARSLSSAGFKILLDIVTAANGRLRIRELPYKFGSRLHGASKLDALIVIDFFGLILAKLTRNLVPVRFLMFALVGAFGIAVHLTALNFLLLLSTFPFVVSQTIATLIAMTNNFLINNQLTYRDQRLRGFAVLKGLFNFYLVCGVGALANVGVASMIYGTRPVWWVAGIAGALMGAIWNYAMSSMFIWRTK